MFGVQLFESIGPTHSRSPPDSRKNSSNTRTRLRDHTRSHKSLKLLRRSRLRSNRRPNRLNALMNYNRHKIGLDSSRLNERHASSSQYRTRRSDRRHKLLRPNYLQRPSRYLVPSSSNPWPSSNCPHSPCCSPHLVHSPGRCPGRRRPSPPPARYSQSFFT